MELNVVGRYIMHLAFGYREFRKNIHCESLRSRSEIAVANHRQNFRCLAMKVTVPAVVMLMSVILAGAFHQDVEFHCAKIRAHHARRPQFIPFDRQFLELRLQVIEIEAQIQQRADRHIAADAGEAVEI